MISGPRPATIHGAVQVAESELTYPEQTAADAAAEKGHVIRFKPGVIRLSY